MITTVTMPRMARRALVLLFLLFGAATASAQVDSSTFADSLLQHLSGQIDMAVPDYPAFAILDAHPTTILRPSKLRTVALTLAGIAAQGAIPSSFALEVAPYGLAAGNQSLASYRSNHLLNSLRISLGTGTDSSGGRSVALGLRLTPIDNTDLRMNEAFLSSLFDIGAKITQIESNCMGQVLAAQNMTRVQYLSLPPAQKASVDSLVRSCAAQNEVATLDSQIVSGRVKYQEQMWNGEILDIGLAVRGDSPDSLAKNSFLSGYGFWTTYAHPLFGQSGQILIGVNAASTRAAVSDSFMLASISLGARLYIGTNALKGFVDYTGTGAIALKGESAGGLTGSLQAGVEMRVIDGLWLDGSLGYRHVPGSPAIFTHTINLRLAALP